MVRFSGVRRLELRQFINTNVIDARLKGVQQVVAQVGNADGLVDNQMICLPVRGIIVGECAADSFKGLTAKGRVIP